MSCAYDVYCRTCDSCLGFESENYHDEQESIIQIATELCKTRKTCRRKKGHEGDHAEKREVTCQ
jgi:hypothetical protein